MYSVNTNKVAIIGAGPAGICAARHLYHNKYNDKKFDIVVYEKQDQVGGVWVYNKWNKQMEEKDTSPMYKDLTTNIPYRSMCYPDFPFPENTATFPFYKDILAYLQNYANHFDIDKFIKFETEVTMVSPLIGKDTTVSENGSDRFIKWKVESKDLQTGRKHSEEFDAVIMCNGSFWNHFFPTIEGFDNFKGEIIHSRFYNNPADFQEKVVMVYGCGSSATDIIKTICDICKNVYISVRSKPVFNGKHPENVTVVTNIKKINDDGEIELVDGEKINADVLIMCTGYTFQFPLTPESKVELRQDGKMVWPVYKNLFHAIYPSLMFPGLVEFCPTFAYMHMECAYITAILTGEIQLPSQKEMLNDLKNREEKVKEGKVKSFHSLTADRWNNYFPELSSEENIPEHIQRSYVNVKKLHFNDFYNFKANFIKEYEAVA